MDPEHAGEIPGPTSLKRPDDRTAAQPALPAILVREPPPADAIVCFEQVSKWYGNVIGVNKLSLRIRRGVTGLLGPNGAGKSTLLQLATGQLYPSQGRVLVLGQAVWNNPGLNQYLGLCPEQDAFWEWMTGRDFIRTCARLTGFRGAEAERLTDRALEMVRMTEHADRAVGGYSKGMRQRTKLAQALVHDPEVLFLDEPFTGTDPVARRDLMDIVIGLGKQGKSVVVSSHVLHEVQSLTQNIVLMNRGRLVAEGTIRDIRDLIDKHPHRIVLVCADFRRLAAELASWEDVEGLKIQPRERSVIAETWAPDAFYARLPELSLRDGTVIEEVYSEDDNLEAVFKYLVKK
jgi:ABC-2 type transport system ATP-binding protein